MSPNQLIVHQVANGAPSPSTFPADSLATALGARLLAAIRGEGRVRLEFSPGPTFLQGEGVVQGGAVSAMLDFAAACAAMTVLEPGTDCTTVTLTTSFLRPVATGTCVAHGAVERRGRNLVFTRASLHESSGSGRALATAVAVLAVVPPRKTDA